jgi:hypothetical protein
MFVPCLSHVLCICPFRQISSFSDKKAEDDDGDGDGDGRRTCRTGGLSFAAPLVGDDSAEAEATAVTEGAEEEAEGVEGVEDTLPEEPEADGLKCCSCGPVTTLAELLGLTFTLLLPMVLLPLLPLLLLLTFTLLLFALLLLLSPLFVGVLETEPTFTTLLLLLLLPLLCAALMPHTPVVRVQASFHVAVAAAAVLFAGVDLC